MKKNIVVLMGCLFGIACSEPAENIDVDNAELAMKLAQETIIVDGHIDVPYRLNNKWADVTKATDHGDFDYPRAVAGGLNAPFMSIYTPAAYDGTEEATAHADAMIDIVERIVSDAPENFTVAVSVDEMEKAFNDGKIAMLLGMENGSPINGSLENLYHFHERGIRYITLAHSKSNHISDSSYDEARLWQGLSEFGTQLVSEMNRLGILIDISHVSDDAFYDVMELTSVPVIASHSSTRHFTPGFERNMDDAMIKKLAENNGIIMINFGSSFVTQEANEYSFERNQAFAAYLTENELDMTSEIRSSFFSEYTKNKPFPYATLEDVLDHIDHVVKLTGSADYVGIGSDYDGVGDSLPVGLKDVSTYPNLVEGLLNRGYSEADIVKILSGNFIRVFKEVEAYALNAQ